jgi:hypothetical protein
MNIPETQHKKVTYRNGETGRLITSVRKETLFKILTLRDKEHSLIHHLANGKCIMTGENSVWDIVEVEE